MGENTATDTNTMSAAIRTPRSVRAPCSSRDSTGPPDNTNPCRGENHAAGPARPIATGGAFRRAPSRARVLSVFPELERGPLALRDDVGLHRLQARVVVGERLAARGILDAPVDHVAQQGRSRNSLRRMRKSQARKFVPATYCARWRRALAYVACTRSSASV